MSYILDALNKSEQERQQREHGVSLQPLTGVPHPGEGNARWLPLAAAAIVVAAIGIFAAVYFTMKAKTPSVQLVQPAAVTPATPSVPVSTAPPLIRPAAPAPAPSVAAAPPPPPASTSTDNSAATARPATSDSVKSLYQRKGMPAEQAMAQAAAKDNRSAPIADNVASEDVVKTDAAVKTFDADRTASVQTRDAARQSTQPASAPSAREKSTVNQKALDAELAREREANRDSELAARVQAELERMQAQDAKDAATKAAAVAKAQPTPAVSKSKPVQPAAALKQTAQAAPAAADPDANVPLATQLPADVQKRIPNIDFGAHVYAGRTNAGFVILNDKKRYPGDTIATGLTVERITEDGVILNLSGTRFKLNSMSSWIN